MTPNPEELERLLRNAVKDIYANGDLAELTVKRVRANVEEEYKLKDGFFKSARWNDRSKAVIQDQAQECDNAPQAEVSPTKKRKVVESIEDDEEDDVKPRKRQANSRVVESDEEDEVEFTAPEKPKQQPEPEVDDADQEASEELSTTVTTEAAKDKTIEDLDDGDLSEVFDEDPKPKPKRKKQTAEKKSKTEPKKRSKASKAPPESDPQAEEIKILQGWLVKCGIRKVWGKYLKPYEMPKDKIRHLKEMLVDVGMTGRYSKEKAESIRNARELAADLEAVQEGAKAWGKESDDERGRAGKRRIARPVRVVQTAESDEED